MTQRVPHLALIAGGGVAGLEALIALHSLAGDHVEITLMAPHDEFIIRALSVQDPFARPAPRRYSVAQICADHGATFVRDALHGVRCETGTVATQSGAELPYDSLVVAVGAHPTPTFTSVIMFRGLQDAEAMHGLIQDVEGGYSKRISFVVPTGVTWPLPLYELALLTAERAADLCLDVALTIVTPEDRPLGIFGPQAGAEVDRVLQEAGISVITGTDVRDVDHGKVRGVSGDVIADAERVVALPRLAGPRIHGVPHHADGFLPVDEHGQVRDVPGVYAAGDGTSFPIKQGGIAAQQADAVAHAIAHRAGARVAPAPFRPTLRAKLLTGRRTMFLREAIDSGAGTGASVASGHTLWWPPTKVAAPYLAPYLERIDRGGGAEQPPHASAPAPILADGDPAGGIEVLGR
jgi:sulfide:quinone oxidoreductase